MEILVEEEKYSEMQFEDKFWSDLAKTFNLTSYFCLIQLMAITSFLDTISHIYLVYNQNHYFGQYFWANTVTSRDRIFEKKTRLDM